MNKHVFKPTMVVILLAFLVSCEFDYHEVMSSRTRQSTYIAQKTIDVKTNLEMQVSSQIQQLLVFDLDTMKIIRNDTIVEKLISYDSKEWLGNRKNGKIIFEGLTKDGRKSFLLEIVNPKDNKGNLILGSIMQGGYNEMNDTLKTVYVEQ
ncbi:hypothetical protein [Dyadobacter sp. CY351]|uniref:hypothetical protein n=1 Tax=Dyadobacter sp. CY351 TaxID=2909337 RepID=UPI001F1E6318|nr:hypothetical protein [Dyadobacter sp. CY351]MCF2520886.1 hypothetical protein [Dyadobacter sp. CY351]